jgi:hypothetical protein
MSSLLGNKLLPSCKAFGKASNNLKLPLAQIQGSPLILTFPSFPTFQAAQLLTRGNDMTKYFQTIESP